MAASAAVPAAGGFPRHPPTCFHRIHGTNVRVDASRTQATRVESFANGLCFSQEPLEPGQIFLVEIEEKELGWCGHLRVGLTALDPGGLEAVPEYSLPDLVNMGDSWVFAITRNHNRVAPVGTEDQPNAGLRGLLSNPYLCIESVRIPREKLVGRSRPGRYSHILDDLYKTNALPATARKSRIGVLYTVQQDGTADMHIVINGEDMGPSARGLPASRPLYAVVDLFASTKRVRVIQVEYGRRYLRGDIPLHLRCQHPRLAQRSSGQMGIRSFGHRHQEIVKAWSMVESPSLEAFKQRLDGHLSCRGCFDVPSLQTLCRLAIQKHIVHRLAIDGLDLPPLLKNYCKYE